MSKKRITKKERRQMNFFKKSEPHLESAGFNRHPHSAISGGATTSEVRVVASDCFKKIKRLFIKQVPEFEKLIFSQLAWVKINCFINLVGDYEVTGFGKVEDGVITDIKILKQSIKSALVDCTAESMVAFLREVGASEINKWCLDWHSHVNMGVTPSHTDKTNWAEQYEARDDKQFPAMIINKRQAIYCHCYMGDDESTPVEVTFFPPEFTEKELKDIYDECAKEVEAKCTKASYTSKPRTTNFYGNSSHVNDYGYEYAYSKCDEPEQKKIIVPDTLKTKSITTVSSGTKCKLCNDPLITENERNNEVCNDCFAKYNCETKIIKCPNCGSELDDDEEKNGICDDCLEQITKG